MKSKINLLLTGFVCFSIATCFSQAIGLTYCLKNGSITKKKIGDMLAVVNGADLLAFEIEAKNIFHPTGTEQTSYDEVVRRRRLLMFDIDRREHAVDQSLSEIQDLKRDVESNIQGFDQLNNMFKESMAKIDKTTISAGMQELQQSIEAMKAKQAKEQIVQLVEDGQMLVAVAIIKAMPINKSKKVISEFKAGDDLKMRFQILELIRLGSPKIDVIRRTREQLTNSNPQS